MGGENNYVQPPFSNRFSVFIVLIQPVFKIPGEKTRIYPFVVISIFASKTQNVAYFFFARVPAV